MKLIPEQLDIARLDLNFLVFQIVLFLCMASALENIEQLDSCR